MGILGGTSWYITGRTAHLTSFTFDSVWEEEIEAAGRELSHALARAIFAITFESTGYSGCVWILLFTYFL